MEKSVQFAALRWQSCTSRIYDGLGVPFNGRSERDYSKETIRRSGAHDISGVAHTIFVGSGAHDICWEWRTRYLLGVAHTKKMDSRKRRGGVGTRRPEADKWQDGSVWKKGAQL